MGLVSRGCGVGPLQIDQSNYQARRRPPSGVLLPLGFKFGFLLLEIHFTVYCIFFFISTVYCIEMLGSVFVHIVLFIPRKEKQKGNIEKEN